MRTRPELLLHPNIPKPLHGLNPRTIFGKEWWDVERQKAYAKTNYHCAACGVHKSQAKYHQWLEAHEFYDIDYKRGTAKMTEIVALCHSCHAYIHSGLQEILLDKGEISLEKYIDIREHGDLLTKGLRKPVAPLVVADWCKWRLIIDGKEYKTKFANALEWKEFYA
jgi:hypothetical protein